MSEEFQLRKKTGGPIQLGQYLMQFTYSNGEVRIHGYKTKSNALNAAATYSSDVRIVPIGYIPTRVANEPKY
ncbi:MAG: hypothetical protein LR017_00745 [Candidatus Pacebacteria bacterium]|nr:hypothetical protein [Candidatus Paceibacterota bacterium]